MNNTDGKKGRTGKRRKREITVTYASGLSIGAFEKALANIYAKKVKNGTLNIQAGGY